jgi:CheY-like chemotaxis protein
MEKEKKILVIDDEDSLRRTVGFGLMQRGYDPELCEDGLSGLQTLWEHRRTNAPLDCAVVDIRLPDIDGLKLLKVIRFSYPGLPVVIITGHGNEEIAKEAKSADGYLEKPFDMDELTKLIESIPEAKIAHFPTPVHVSLQAYNAYVLVSLEPTANLMEVYRKLYFADNMVYCDAVRGECDLVVLLQAETPEKVAAIIEEQIKTTPGVADVTALNIEPPAFAETVVEIIGAADKALARKSEAEIYSRSREGATSYVLLEIEKGKLQSIYPALYINENVIYSDYTTGGKYDIVMLLKGTSFSDVDEVIKTKITTLDGVLRVTEWPIVALSRHVSVTPEP